MEIGFRSQKYREISRNKTWPGVFEDNYDYKGVVAEYKFASEETVELISGGSRIINGVNVKLSNHPWTVFMTTCDQG